MGTFLKLRVGIHSWWGWAEGVCTEILCNLAQSSGGEILEDQGERFPLIFALLLKEL